MMQGTALFLLSLVATSSLLLKTTVNGRNFLKSVVPRYGWPGLMFCLWGIYSFMYNGLLKSEAWRDGAFLWTGLLIVNVLQIAIGYLMAYGLVIKYVFSGDETALRKRDQLIERLSLLQSKTGIAGLIAGGGYMLVSAFY